MALSVGVGLGGRGGLMEEEVSEVVGDQGRHDPERSAVRHGHEAGEVTLGGRRVGLECPRVRATDGSGEVGLSVYRHFADRDPLSRIVLERMLAGTVVGVTLVDVGGGLGGSMMGGGSYRGMMMRLTVSPSAVPPGLVSFRALNVGRRTHELVVLPLAPGRQAGERPIASGNRVAETGSLGEASRTCGAGAGEGIEPEASGWVTIDLNARRYELVCNLPGHYRAGMYGELTVL